MIAPAAQIMLTAGRAGGNVLPMNALYRANQSHRLRDQRRHRCPAARTINWLLADGRLRPDVTEILRLVQAPHVHQRLEDKRVQGRIVLTP